MNRRITAVIVIGFLSSFFGCGGQEKSSDETDHPQYEQADIYRDLREQVLKLRYEKSEPAHASSGPVAILMETGYPEAVATLVAAMDGTTSLYFSNGGGIIGAGDHEQVRAATASFLQFARGFAAEMTPTDSYPLPRKRAVRFYVVNTNAVLTAEANEDDLGNMRHPLSPLFHKGHEVIAAIQQHAPQ
jgi:hypothetical protein